MPPAEVDGCQRKTGVYAVHQPAGKQRPQRAARLIHGRDNCGLGERHPQRVDKRRQPAANKVDQKQSHKIAAPEHQAAKQIGLRYHGGYRAAPHVQSFTGVIAAAWRHLAGQHTLKDRVYTRRRRALVNKETHRLRQAIQQPGQHQQRQNTAHQSATFRSIFRHQRAHVGHGGTQPQSGQEAKQHHLLDVLRQRGGQRPEPKKEHAEQDHDAASVAIGQRPGHHRPQRQTNQRGADHHAQLMVCYAPACF
ncbi:hypothetical protein COLO4_01480 [Corchorus olitorius]|uniref:Uncharacterized protein n=1 Tax=Corchorus olitorius TaxID=93759 RepID=A0A1R3L2M3_9ROSI|nr:hypothetical protein COLO4_01480 [Corchorus olitorius]